MQCRSDLEELNTQDRFCVFVGTDGPGTEKSLNNLTKKSHSV